MDVQNDNVIWMVRLKKKEYIMPELIKYIDLKRRNNLRGNSRVREEKNYGKAFGPRLFTQRNGRSERDFWEVCFWVKKVFRATLFFVYLRYKRVRA